MRNRTALAMTLLMLLPHAFGQAQTETPIPTASPTPTAPPEETLSADLNQDGQVDANDLFILHQHWHEGVAPATEEKFTHAPFSDYYNPPSFSVIPSVTPYNLPLDVADISNWESVCRQFDLSTVRSLIEQNGFGVLASATGEDVIKPYRMLERAGIPIFVTVDTLLHLYHVQFDETLKEVEEREFFDSLLSLTRSLLTDAIQLEEEYQGEDYLYQAALRNVAYFSVALKLLEPSAVTPEAVSNLVNQELQLIESHSGFSASPIFIYEEDYSQYVPRGHYTRSEILQRYFRVMMWYGRIGFLLRNSDILSSPNAEIQTLGACLISDALKRVEVDEQNALEVWDRIYAVTAFYVGLADDLTPLEYQKAIEEVAGTAATMRAITDPETFTALRAWLANLRNPGIYGGTGNCVILPPFDPSQIDECLDKSKGFRFMGQRFIPDSYVFQNLVSADYIGTGTPFTMVISGAGRPMRGFPRGLDAMDILGSTRAYEILVEEGDTEYSQYPDQRQELIDEFALFSVQDWNRNLYWGWLYTLKSLLGSYGPGYPSFMQTRAWVDKSLSTALASWSELRHDTILYAKQSYTPSETSIPPFRPGYVEPAPDFYARLLALTEMTQEGLANLGLLDAEALERLQNLSGIIEILLGLSLKELNNSPLTHEEYEYIRYIGGELEEIVIGVEDTGVVTTLIADVHTEANTGRVLEEAVGYVDYLVAVIPQPDGTLNLAMGPVLSYYEFKWPMENRLTDEAWRDKLASDPPSRPPWTASFVP